MRSARFAASERSAAPSSPDGSVPPGARARRCALSGTRQARQPAARALGADEAWWRPVAADETHALHDVATDGLVQALRDPRCEQRELLSPDRFGDRDHQLAAHQAHRGGAARDLRSERGGPVLGELPDVARRLEAGAVEGAAEDVAEIENHRLTPGAPAAAAALRGGLLPSRRSPLTVLHLV